MRALRPFLSTGGCTCLSELWRFRDWSASSTSKGSAGNRFSDGGQRHERVGSQPFEGSPATIEQKAETQILAYPAISAACWKHTELKELPSIRFPSCLAGGRDRQAHLICSGTVIFGSPQPKVEELPVFPFFVTFLLVPY